MSVPEEPLERVNYFNGQRLEAGDFRAEQEYQLRVRRWLNRSLYWPGVVKGLEVGKHPSDTHKVLVLPGLAFDIWGREIILVDTCEVPVRGVPSTAEGVVFGNYLVISYAEERALPVTDGCAVASDAKPCRSDLAWGAPTRIRAAPRLEFVDSWPVDETGKVVLAQLELLAKNYSVKTVNQGVRKYAVPAKPPKTRPISLEGEKDIDRDNPKVLYFHIADGYPEAVVLYLRGAMFSTLYYTELGSHTHTLDLVLSQALGMPEHDHSLGELLTDEYPAHSHRITANVEDPNDHDALEMQGRDTTLELNSAVAMNVSAEAKHSHKIAAGAKTDKAPGLIPHSHSFTQKDVQPFGAAQEAAHSGPALRYADSVQIKLDGKNITAQVLQQLAGRDPANWRGKNLGGGKQDHVFVNTGTGSIELHRIIGNLGPGAHVLEFSVASGGGKIYYNLYVE